ncbi:MAG: hypothetical protein AB1485_05105 [Candidatus Thermoplasmatota archaeon]
MEEKITLDEIYKAFRWDERLEKVRRPKILEKGALRFVRSCLVTFSAYIILVLIISLLNDILYYISNGTRHIECTELFLIIIIPSVFLGLVTALMPAVVQK